jgi:RimJ/RimL family protein N-acetyltransferase
MPIPSVDTERLTLRAHAIDDFAECAAMWADPEVTRHIGGRPFTGEEVWTRLLRYAGHWQLLGFGYWVVREAATGRFAGEVGFADMRREIQPSFDGTPEIGWALAPWCHGRGFATEAVRAIVAWGESHLPSQRTVCMIDEDNVRSIRVAEKCGYREWRRTTYHGAPTILFER